MTTLLERTALEQLIRFYEARAQGGVALVVLSLQALWPGVSAPGSGRHQPSPWLNATGVDQADRLATCATRIKAAGARVFAQLQVGSVWAPEGTPGVTIPLSPSGRLPAGPGFRPDASRLPFYQTEASTPAHVLARLPDAIAQAATRVVDAGCDGVQISAAGGSLLAQFLSPVLNVRDDEYGGTTSRRARLLLETVSAVRAVLPSATALTCRINGADLVKGGLEPSDYADLAVQLAQAGVHAIDVMPGGFVTRRPVHHRHVVPGTFADVSRTIRQRVSIPVAANSRIVTPDAARRLISSGACDYVSLGTPLLADPAWVHKARGTTPGPIRPCLACGACWDDLLEYHRPVSCVVNPTAGHEGEPAPPVAEVRRRVVVVGGGPTGLTAAAEAAQRGHDVVLVDDHLEPGGALLAASQTIGGAVFRQLAGYLADAATRAGVDLQMGTRLEPSAWQSLEPDVVILAVGCAPKSLEASQAGAPTLLSYAEAVEMTPVAPWWRAVVIGGGMAAAEVARHLANRGLATEVVLLSPDGPLAGSFGAWQRWTELDALDETRIVRHDGVGPVRLVPGGVEFAAPGTHTTTCRCQAVVVPVHQSAGPVLASDHARPVQVMTAHARSDDRHSIGAAILAGRAAGRRC